MPTRLIRLQQTGHSHLITFTCYHRMQFLSGAPACVAVLQSLENARRRYVFRVYAFVLMPEHVHLLLSEPANGTLARAMQSLKSASARVARAADDNISGAAPRFWQARYYDRYMRNHEDFSEKLNYIHNNPVKRGLCAAQEDWPWSSFRHYADGSDIGVEIESEWMAQTRAVEGELS